MKKNIKSSIILVLMLLPCTLQSGILPDSAGITFNRQLDVYLQPEERTGEWMVPSVALWVLYRIDRSLKISRVARKYRRKIERKIRKRMNKWLKDRFKE